MVNGGMPPHFFPCTMISNPSQTNLLKIDLFGHWRRHEHCVYYWQPRLGGGLGVFRVYLLQAEEAEGVSSVVQGVRVRSVIVEVGSGWP